MFCYCHYKYQRFPLESMITYFVAMFTHNLLLRVARKPKVLFKWRALFTSFKRSRALANQWLTL